MIENETCGSKPLVLGEGGINGDTQLKREVDNMLSETWGTRFDVA